MPAGALAAAGSWFGAASLTGPAWPAHMAPCVLGGALAIDVGALAATPSAEPGFRERGALDGTPGTALRFRTGLSSASLSVRVRGGARVGHILWEVGGAPATVDVHTSGDGGRSWALVDKVNLTAAPANTIYADAADALARAPPPPVGAPPEPMRPLPLLDPTRGTLICCCAYGDDGGDGDGLDNENIHGNDGDINRDDDDVGTVHVPPPTATTAADNTTTNGSSTMLRITVRGFHASNLRHVVGIAALRLFAAPGALVPIASPEWSGHAAVASLATRVDALISASLDGTLTMAQKSRAARQVAFLTLVSGSGSCAARIASALLRCGGGPSGHNRGQNLADAAVSLACAMRKFQALRSRAAALGAWLGSFAEAAPSAALFDAAGDAHTQGVALTGGGATIVTTAGGRHFALAARGLTTGSGVHSWAFRLDRDVAGDECVCFGFALRPVRVADYEASHDLFVVRAYNAHVYGRTTSRRLRVIPHGPIHEGSTVAFVLNTATRAITCSVDGLEQGVVWMLPSAADLADGAMAAARAAGRPPLPPGLASAPLIFPAVALYGENRAVTLLSITSSGTPAPALDGLGTVRLCDAPLRIGLPVSSAGSGGSGSGATVRGGEVSTDSEDADAESSDDEGYDGGGGRGGVPPPQTYPCTRGS